jgi:hypothetical protein
MATWAAANLDDFNKYLKDFNVTNATSDEWRYREGVVKDMVEAVSKVDHDDNEDTEDITDYDLQIKAAKSAGYTVDESNIVRQDGKITGYKDNSGHLVDSIWEVAKDQREVIWDTKDFGDIKTQLENHAGMSSADAFSYGDL